MAIAIKCPNQPVNLQMCPCPSEDCERKGICCLCAAFHVGKDQRTFCMRGTARPAETLSLQGAATSKCESYKKNLKGCACDYEPCGNRGTCCDCVRNHWGNSTYPLPACMKA